MTESWLSPGYGQDHTINEIKSFGFNLSLTSRRYRRGGGVAILVKNTLKFSSLKLSSSCSSFEWNGIRVFGIATTYCIVCIYRKQEISIITFLEELADLLDAVCLSSTDELIVLGDFNVHFETSDKPSKDLASLLSGYGLAQQVTGRTRISDHTLDLVFCNESCLNINAVVKPDITETFDRRIKFDHFPVTFSIPICLRQNHLFSSVPEIRHSRNLRHIDTDEFNLSLQDKLSSVFHQSSESSFSDQLSVYNHVLIDTLDKFAPVQKRFITPRGSEPLPKWMDSEFIKQRSLRRKLERQWKKYGGEEAHRKHIEQRDLCVALANDKQRRYYSNLVSSSDNQNTLFKTVSKLWNKTKKKALPSSKGTSYDLANDFNSFFVSKISQIREQFHSNLNSSSTDSSVSCTLDKFEPVSFERLRDIVTKEMDIKTSSDDPLPAPVLKPAIEPLLPYLHELVNLSLETGDISGLKESVIKPILKKVDLDKECMANYRPIVNLQFLSKLIERVVLEQLTKHMTDHNLHSPHQFAYKKNFSTETMILEIVDEVLVGFEEGSGTILVLLDMSAAFDTVDVPHLLKVLENDIGIKGTALRWFKSFLVGRKQKVSINGELSKVLLALYGVPQGSVLGPVLFNIYVRSLPDYIKSHGFRSSTYADDSNARLKLSFKFQSHNTMVKVPELINGICSWMKERFLKLNPSKTEIILFCPPGAKHIPKILGTFVQNSCIRFSTSVKLLGVHLDSYLNFDGHVDKLVSDCFYHLRNIAKIKRYLTDSQSQKLIHAFVSSKLDYSNAVLSGIKSTTLIKLQRVQNYAARLAVGFSSRTICTESILKKLHWLTVKQRINFKLLLLTHKFFIGIAPNYFNDILLIKDNVERLLFMKFMNTVSGRRSFGYTAPRLWNRLPRDIRILNNTDSFKKALKTVLFTNQNNINDAVRLYNQ